jgi:hypothetical protein
MWYSGSVMQQIYIVLTWVCRWRRVECVGRQRLTWRRRALSLCGHQLEHRGPWRVSSPLLWCLYRMRKRMRLGQTSSCLWQWRTLLYHLLLLGCWWGHAIHRDPILRQKLVQVNILHTETQNKYLIKNYTVHLYTSLKTLTTVFKLKLRKRRPHKEVVHISTNVSKKLVALIFRICTLKTKPASSFET